MEAKQSLGVWGAPEDKAVNMGYFLFIPEKGKVQDGSGLMARLDQHVQLCCLRKEVTATLPASYTVVLILNESWARVTGH